MMNLVRSLSLDSRNGPLVKAAGNEDTGEAD